MGVPLLQAPFVIGAARAPDIVLLQTGGSIVGTIWITAGSVLFEVITSFGFVSSAVFVRNVGAETTRTGTVIVGKEAPTARGSVRLQLNIVEPFAPVQVHPGPVGVLVRLTPAGSGSLTVVVEFRSAPEPTFRISIVYVKVAFVFRVTAVALFCASVPLTYFFRARSGDVGATGV
jgi:hypothetical protein